MGSMGCYGDSNEDIERHKRLRKEIEQKLIAKGLIKGSNKFEKVMHRKVSKIF
jgi:hypothetical protein